jgi:NAD(P)H dehydrogenase (quinone)
VNVLIVFAHPEPRSLAASLRDVAAETLQADGNQVQISDLYAMGWKAEVDRADFPTLKPAARLQVVAASGEAFASKTLTDDVKAEHQILKGWVDRVYALGFAYGAGEHSDRRWGDRYGEGIFAGKRAVLVVTTGGWEEHYGPRGINGPIDDLLFPINHRILHYPGFKVLPPFVAYRVDRLDAHGFEVAAEALRARMRSLPSIEPIPFRRQNGGDSLIPSLQLRPDLDAPDMSGFSLRIRAAP